MASGDLRPKLSILLSQWIIILVIKYAWYQFWEIGQFWIIKIHTWLRGWRILCSRQDTLTFQTRSLAWENFWKRSCDAVGRMGSRCLSRALGGKAARMAASLTCARTIPPATQAEEKEVALRFMKEKCFSFFLFPVSVRPGILTIPNWPLSPNIYRFCLKDRHPLLSLRSTSIIMSSAWRNPTKKAVPLS